MAEPTLLVHACCAQCLAAILDPLRRLGCWAAYFYNPNIQPLIEFRRRAKSLHVLAERERLALIADERYDVRGFLRSVPWDRPERCLACYRMRLDETARMAAEKGISAMTTTLLASEHQDHEAVRRLGEEAAAGRGLGFHYEDWRALAGRGREEAKRRSLYRQQYCGCLFSEEERFAPTSLHLYRGSKTAEQIREGET
ncbi:MAG: epoxyqueuosine reductase QueH [Phycisphaerae bacterium]